MREKEGLDNNAQVSVSRVGPPAEVEDKGGSGRRMRSSVWDLGFPQGAVQEAVDKWPISSVARGRDGS